MSGFAFSHQFSQRWLTTPPPVKQAIIQELEDIMTLLQPETDFESYRFSTDDLHEKVEQLMMMETIRLEKIEAEKRKRDKEERERLEQLRLEQEKIEQQKRKIEQLRLEQERLALEIQQQELNQQLEKDQDEAARLAQDQAEISALQHERAIAKQVYQKQLNDEHLSQPTTTSRKNELVYAISETSRISQVIDIEEVEEVDRVAENTNDNSDDFIDINEIADINPVTPVENLENATSSSLPIATISDASVEKPSPTDQSGENSYQLMESGHTEMPLDIVKQDIIKQLKNQIDTYLVEYMGSMSEDLQIWLKEEVDKQLKERLAQGEQSK